MALSVGAGTLGALALALLYLAIVGFTQDWSHALELLWGDRLFVVAIAAGFGTQVGLYTHMRTMLHITERMGASTALTATGTGASSISMVACCLHHLTDMVPFLGLSGASVFLTQYRGSLMVLGILINLIGIVVMLRRLRSLRQWRPQEALR